MENDIKYVYLRERNGQPVGCIAFRVNKVDHRIHFAVSTHNPVDKFDRELGREIAANRLEKDRNAFFTLYDVENPSVHAVINDLMLIIADNAVNAEGQRDFTTRARRAAQLWLRDHNVDA